VPQRKSFRKKSAGDILELLLVKDKYSAASELRKNPRKADIGLQLHMKDKKKSKKKSDEFDSGFYGYPIGTLAFYGADNKFASKVAVGVIENEDSDAEITVWFSDQEDVRNDRRIGDEVTKYLTKRGVKSVVASDGIIGCPHEEGVDYPVGEHCPKCPYWKGRDRFKPDAIQ
jgi:hypothetical protein